MVKDHSRTVFSRNIIRLNMYFIMHIVTRISTHLLAMYEIISRERGSHRQQRLIRWIPAKMQDQRTFPSDGEAGNISDINQRWAVVQHAYELKDRDETAFQ